MKIGIISAMESEHRQLAARLTDAQEIKIGPFSYVKGSLCDNELILTQCGIAKVNAALGAQAMILNYKPDCIINTGVAGGIDECLKRTDVVVGARTVHHDVWCGSGEHGQVQGLPLFFEGDRHLLAKALELNQMDLESTVHAGLICTGEQFIEDREVLRGIKEHFPDGMAVDMESASIAQACHLYGVPFLSFRIISDVPGDGDNFSQYRDFWHTIAERSFHTTWTFLQTLKVED